MAFRTDRRAFAAWRATADAPSADPLGCDAVAGRWWPRECATKRGDGMRGNLHRLYRQAASPWGVASGGCTPEVKKLPLKGTGEARCRPPRGRAWLRDRMVSTNKAGVNLRETTPLPRNILHNPALATGLTRGSDRVQRQIMIRRTTEADGYRMPAKRSSEAT
jgi:hypothetical protein